ncbi:hypothetical protein TCSYLVIO_001244 [Trypanosoma cruzi]|nr:hypothetical protein TCSYLVIO_001244 [Trypanosoma cruzi]
MSHKYILQGNSPLSKAVLCVLRMFSVPMEQILTDGTHFAVNDGSVIHIGLLPILMVLRKSSETPELRAFVGAEAEVLPLVNQWISTALLLSADAAGARATACATTPLATHVFAEIERCVESFKLKNSFLAGTPRATVADLLLYAAIHGHPNGLTEALPSTLAWSRHAQQDAYLEPILSAPTAKATAAAHNASKVKKTIYVKPSEEEILRRRQEKEKEKEQKTKLAQAANTSTAATSSGTKDGHTTQKRGQKEQSQQAAAPDPNQIDIRVGRFKNIKRHPDADRLYVEEMDLGTETRTIVSGLVGHYTAEELEGSLCLTVCNMKPKPLKGINSEGMILCASNEAELRLVQPPDGAKPGDRILFADAFNAEALKETKQLSSHVMGDLIGFLHTDDEGILRWRDIPAQHAYGVVRVPDITNAIVK